MTVSTKFAAQTLAVLMASALAKPASTGEVIADTDALIALQETR